MSQGEELKVVGSDLFNKILVQWAEIAKSIHILDKNLDKEIEDITELMHLLPDRKDLFESEKAGISLLSSQIKSFITTYGLNQ